MPKWRWMVSALCCLVIGAALAANAMKRDEIDGSKPFFKIDLVYNYDVYKRPVFFMPKSQPSFGIWIQERQTGYRESLFVTRKAGKNLWHFAKKRPEAIPVWYGVHQQEIQRPSYDLDAISAATPVGDRVTIFCQVPEKLIGKAVDIYLEANNSFDFNRHYHKQKGTPGYSGANGQPSVVWKASVDLSKPPNKPIFPQIVGHGHLFGENHRIHVDISKLTSAALTFHEIRIGVYQP